MQREWVLTSATGVNPSMWGSTITDTITFNLNPDQFTDVNEITQIIKLRVTGKANATDIVNITTPAEAWVSQTNTALNMYSYGTQQTYTTQMNTNTPSGIVAYVKQLGEYSYGNFYDNELIEVLTTPYPISLLKFDVCRKPKFDLDFAAKENKYLSIKTITLGYTWYPQSLLFQPPVASPNFQVVVDGIDYIYPKYTIMPDIMREIDPVRFQVPVTRTYIQSVALVAGTTTISVTITPPGVPKDCTYFLLQHTSNSQDGLVQGVFSLNPNDSSIVKSVIFNTGGKNFPVTSAYNSVKTATENANWIRHYDDYQKLSGNWSNKKDSIQTAQTWLNKNRIYKVGFAGVSSGCTISVTLELASAIIVPCTAVFYIKYIDQAIVNLLKENKVEMESS